MSPPISTEMRARMIVWHYELHKTAKEISLLAGCSLSSVYVVLRYDQDFGQTSNPFARSVGRQRALDIGDVNYVSALEANPAIYLDEIQFQLQ
jgi:hypothetical protein